MNILVTDDGGLARAIGRDLTAIPGWIVRFSPDDQCLPHVLRGRCDILLGLDSPAFLDRLSQLRHAGSSAPVVVVTASGQAGARIAALRAGADDAVDHPYLAEELVLRVTRLARRTVPDDGRRTVAGGLMIDRLERRVWRDGREIMLLPREFALLLYLVHNQGRTLDRRTLLAAVWKLLFDPGTNVVEVHMSRLRAKLDRGFDGPLIETVKGMGYRFATRPENTPGRRAGGFEQVTSPAACVR